VTEHKSSHTRHCLEWLLQSCFSRCNRRRKHDEQRSHSTTFWSWDIRNYLLCAGGSRGEL